MPKDSGSWFKMPDMGSSKTQVLDGDAPQVALPSADFAADATYVQDGADLRMTGPDGQVVVIRGYFDGNPPALTTPEGGQLPPSLVKSFVTPEHAGEYAGPMGDAPAVGEVYKIEGDAWVTHADGTREALELGAPIFQGDVVETSTDGAVNILFDDETRFAVSQDARLSIDEFNFTPGQGGESNFSMLKGVFVYTSGLIGKEDPDDVEINTPVGSIGIRGTVVGGVIDGSGSQITVIEGSVTFTNSGGIVVLDDANETLVASSFDTTATNIGTMDSGSVESTFSSLSGVANDMYGAITTQQPNGQTDGTTTDGTQTTTDAAAATGDATQTTDGTQQTAPAPDGSAPPPDGSQPPPDGSEPPPPDGSTTDTQLQPPPDGSEPPPPPPPDGTMLLDGSGDVLITEQPVGTDPILSGDTTLITTDTTTTTTTTLNGGTTTTTADATLPPPPPPPPPGGTTTTTSGTTTTTSPPPNLLPNVTGTFPAADVGRSGTTFSYDFSNLFTDPEGTSINVSIQGPLPPFLTYDPVLQTLTGTPSDLDFGNHQITVRGTDADGLFRDVTFTFTVADNDGDIDMTSVFAGPSGFSLLGDSGGAAGDNFGGAVAGIGDINHDGFADVMVGAPGADTAYVIFGGPQGIPRSFDVNTLNGTNGFSISGITGALGLSVTGLGDIDGDGLDDYAVGAPSATSIDPNSGGAFILYGQFIGPGGTSFGANLNLSTDLAAFGTGGLGFAAGDFANTGSVADEGGYVITGVGDFNGDGYGDFMVTVPGADSPSADAGVVRLVLGGQYLSEANIGAALQPGTDTMSNMPDAGGEIGTAFMGPMTSSALGMAAGGGDLNGDGNADLVMGAPVASKVFVAYGMDGTFNALPSVDLSNATDINNNNIAIFEGNAGSQFGSAVAMDGDLNGDGYDDLVVGAFLEGSGNGAVYIFNGQAGGWAGGTGSIHTVAGSAQDHTIVGSTGENFGYSVSYAGDFNGDGYDDLIVGSDNGSTSSVSILWGSATGINLTDTNFATQNDGMHLFDTSYSGLGNTVSAAGDINGDGFDDIIIGAPYTGAANEGGSTIVYGGNFTGAVTQMGTDFNDNLRAIHGTGQDVMVAGTGNDSVIGDGGQDVYRLGAGDDKLAIADANYLEIDGGSGKDELFLNGAFTLDLSVGGQQNRIEGIEVFNMANGMANNMKLGLEDILQSDINEITIIGDGQDSFSADFSGTNFTQSGFDQHMQDMGVNAQGFHVFSNGSVTLLVDSQIATVNVTL